MLSTDVFIIGGGPAGLTAAIALRKRGFRVTVADGIVPPADKACGEGLMPDALAALARLGVRIEDRDSFPFRGIRFVDGGASAAGDFPAGAGRGIRRTTLHRILVEHAESAGVALRWGAPVQFGALPCAWIVGADGESSLVRKWAGLDRRIYDRQRFGFRRHYRLEPWTDYMELYWGDRCQIYVTPVAADSVCVAAISRDPQFRLDDALRNIPQLARRLDGRTILSLERGAVTSSRRLHAVYRGRVALAGDASGSVDAITGEGLCLAFRQATALAGAIESGDLGLYQRTHREIARRAARMARVLLWLADYAPIRRAAIRVLGACPTVFEKMLAVHTGALHEIRSPDAFDLAASAGWPGDGARTRPRADASPVHSK